MMIVFGMSFGEAGMWQYAPYLIERGNHFSLYDFGKVVDFGIGQLKLQSGAHDNHGSRSFLLWDHVD